MSEKRNFFMPKHSLPPHIQHPNAAESNEIDGIEITQLTQEILAKDSKCYIFTNKNYTLTEPVVIGDGKTLEIKRGTVLTIRDGGALIVIGTGKLINNSQVFVKEGGRVSDEDAKLQGLFGEGYWRIMKGAFFTINGIKIASPDVDDGAFARVNSGWLSVQHRELETKRVNLTVAGTRDEPGNVFFYRIDSSILFDVEGNGEKDRNMVLNVTRNSTATIMGNVCLTSDVEVKVNGTIYINDATEGDGKATFVVSNMPDTFSFGKIEARRQGILGLNVHAPLGMEFIIHKDAVLYGESGCMVEPIGGEEATFAFTENAKYTMYSTPDKWHVYCFEKDEEADSDAAVILQNHKVQFEFALEIGKDVSAYIADGKEVLVDGGVVLVKGMLIQEGNNPYYSIEDGSGKVAGTGKVILVGNGALKLETNNWASDPNSGLAVERLI